MKNKLLFLVAGIIIIVCTFFAQQYFLDTRRSAHFSNGMKHFVEIGLVFLVGLIGYIGLKSRFTDWQPKVWLFIYGISFLLLSLLAITDVFIYTIAKNNQYRFVSIKSLLASPLPYWGIWLLSSIKFSSKS